MTRCNSEINHSHVREAKERGTMDKSYVLTSLTSLFSTTSLALYCAVLFFPQEPANPIVNGFGIGLLVLIPGVIACVPYLFHLTHSLHRLTWAGSSLLALVAVGLFTLIIDAESDLWLFFVGQAFVLGGYALTLALEQRSERERRITLIVVRVLGVLAIVLPTIGALSISMSDGFQISAFIMPTLLLACAACFGLNARINGFPVGYALPIVIGVIAILSLAVVESFIVLGVWTLGTMCVSAGMVALAIDSSLPQATHNSKPEEPRAPKPKTPQTSGSASA